MQRFINILFLAFIGILVLSGPALFSQEGVGRGRIKGTITDNAGNPLEGVKIVAKHTGGFFLEAITDKDGTWAMAGLGTGMFRITATKEGYQETFMDKKLSQFKNEPIDFMLNKIVTLPEGTPQIENAESRAVLEEGFELYEAEQYAEALSKFRAFLEENPTVTQIRVNIANCLRQLEQFPEALDEYQKVLDAIESEKGTLAGDALAAGILADMGGIFISQEDFEKASEYFQRSIDVNPQDERLAFNVAEIYFNQGQREKAIEAYNLAIEINPAWPRPYRQLGYAYLNKGDYKAALDSFNKFLELAPDDPQAPTIRNLIPSIENLIK